MAKYLPFLFSLKQQKELDAEIFQRKESEEKLSKVKNDFQLLVSSVKDYAILLLDTEGRVASWNSGAEHIKGYTAEEIIGKPLDVFYTPEERASGVPPKNLQMALERGHFETEGLRLRKDGSSFYANVVFTSLYNEDGKLYGYAKVTKDITEKRKADEALKNSNKELIISRNKIEESEQRFRNVIEQAINPILILKGEDMKLELANKPLFKLWNIGKESIGKPFLKILPEMKDQPFLELLMDVLHNGTTHYGNEEPAYFIRENGEKEIFYFNFVYSPYRENDKSISGIIVQATDVSINVISRKKVETSEADLIIANNGLVETKSLLSKLNAELEEKVQVRTAAIYKNEKRFRALVENNYDIISLLDESYKIIYRSPSATRVLGWSNDEMKDADGFNNLHPDDREMTRVLIGEATANPGKPINALFRRLHKSGNYVSLQGVVTNLLHDENIKAFVFNFRDVTEQKEAEEKLIASEKQFRSTLDNMMEGAQIIDFNWQYTYVNDAFTRHAKYSKEELIGYTVMEKFPGIEHTEIFKVYKRCFNERISLNLENEFIFPDGLSGWFELSFQPVHKGIFILSVDITERKNAEEQLKKSFVEKQALAKRMSTILNTLPANIALLDAKGIVVDVNDSWKKFADDNDYAGGNYCIGDNYIKIANESFGKDEYDGKAVARGVSDVIEKNAKEFVYEYPCHSADVKRWFRMVVTPLQEKEYSGAVVMHIDISELRRLEDERIKSKIDEQHKITEAIINTQENERNFIAQELHDNVNQILAGTNLILSIAKNYPEQSKEHIQSAMNNIMDAIEENRKIAHTLITPDFENIHLAEQISSLADNMLKQSGINVYFKAEQLDENTIDDKIKLALYRIAQEQCTNIIKYANATLVNILFEINAGFFKMTIADNGKGMEKDKKKTDIGIKNIRARLSIFNGGASIKSSPGEGFLLEVKIPLTS